MKMNKTTVTLIALIVWTVFSIGYICVSKWDQFKVVQMNQAYQQGLAQAVSDIITQSEKCEAVPLSVGDKKADIVAVSCLQKPADGAATTPSATPTAPKK